MDVKIFLKKKKELKLSYDELAELSGIPKTTLTNILLGRTLNPRIDTIQAIERALGLSEESVKNADDFPISFEEFSAEFDKNKRLQQIAALPPEKQKIVFDTIDALLKNLEK